MEQDDKLIREQEEKTLTKVETGGDVRWKTSDGKNTGYGFTVKRDNTTALLRCPQCGRENYALSVLSGICSWCAFNANE